MGDNTDNTNLNSGNHSSHLEIGELYPYWDYINPPEKLGITSDGNFPAFVKDIGGLFEYGQLLLLSDSKASKTGHALGNKYFLNTGGQCCPTTDKDPWGGTPCDKSSLVDRYIYINTIPTGQLPFINPENISTPAEFTGLLPGILEDVFKIPIEITGLLGALIEPVHPPCISLKLDVINAKNEKSIEEHHVASSDIVGMRPSDFVYSGRVNPVSGRPNTEFFSNMETKECDIMIPGLNELNTNSIENNIFIKEPIIGLYFILLIILALYIFYKLFYISRK